MPLPAPPKHRRSKPGAASLVLTWVLLVAFGSAVRAGDSRAAAQAYNRGNALYKHGSYGAAAKSYERCVALGGRTAAVYYNLGNAYFQTGDLGRAILAYERARRLRPRDRDLFDNLHQARMLTRDEITPPVRSGPGAALDLALSRYAVNELVRTVSLVYLALLAALFLRLFASSVGWRKGMGALALALSFLVVTGTATVALKVHRERADRSAVILAREVAVRSGPSPNFDTVFKVHAGTLVNIIETRGLWDRIAASPELTGWVPRDTVQQVWERDRGGRRPNPEPSHRRR